MTVFVAFSLSLSEAVKNDVYSRIGAGSSRGTFALVMKEGGQYCVMFLLFLFLLYYVPNVKVKFSAAAAGSLFGTIVMTIFYQIFTHLIISSVKFSVIYGSLAAILLVLFYCYVVWYIIILTAETTFIYQFRPEKDSYDDSILTPEREIDEGMRVLAEAARSFEKGEGGISAFKASSRAGVIYFRTTTYLKLLAANGFIKELTTSEYILARPSSEIKLSDVVTALFTGDGLDETSLLRTFYTSGIKALEGLTLADILKRNA